MSPFLYADQLSGALLIYHGEDDQNVGTFPDNSWRLIHGLNGLGKTAALYMYPFEDHGQVARETLLDMWARWVAWLDHYVKDADPTWTPRRHPVAVVADDDAERRKRRDGGPADAESSRSLQEQGRVPSKGSAPSPARSTRITGYAPSRARWRKAS
jgi:hypothetical protein